MSKLAKIQRYLNELQPALPDEQHEYIVLTTREYVWSIVCETKNTFGREVWNRTKNCTETAYTIVDKQDIQDILSEISETVEELLFESKVRSVKHLFK